MQRDRSRSSADHALVHWKRHHALRGDRDVEEKESARKFISRTLNLIGEAAEIRRTSKRNKILSALLTADAPISPRELSIAAGMPRNNVDQLLFKMGKAGEVNKAGRGNYVHPDRTDLLPRLVRLIRR